MLIRFLVLLPCCLFLSSAQTTSPGPGQTTQISSTTTTTSVTTTSSSSSSSSSPSSSISTSTPTPTTTTTPTTIPIQQGPVGQPAPTTGTPGGPTPYTYSTVVNGVVTVISAIFTPTNPATIPVTPTAVGTILDFSSWLAIYGPTQMPSVNAGYALHPISFPLVLMLLLGILCGRGMLYV